VYTSDSYESIPYLAVLVTSVASFLNTYLAVLVTSVASFLNTSSEDIGVEVNCLKRAEKGSSSLDAAENYDVPSLFMELS
jgi:hypothetical protein